MFSVNDGNIVLIHHLAIGDTRYAKRVKEKSQYLDTPQNRLIISQLLKIGKVKSGGHLIRKNNNGS